MTLCRIRGTENGWRNNFCSVMFIIIQGSASHTFWKLFVYLQKQPCGLGHHTLPNLWHQFRLKLLMKIDYRLTFRDQSGEDPIFDTLQICSSMPEILKKQKKKKKTFRFSVPTFDSDWIKVIMVSLLSLSRCEVVIGDLPGYVSLSLSGSEHGGICISDDADVHVSSFSRPATSSPVCAWLISVLCTVYSNTNHMDSDQASSCHWSSNWK